MRQERGINTENHQDAIQAEFMFYCDQEWRPVLSALQGGPTEGDQVMMTTDILRRFSQGFPVTLAADSTLR